MEYLETDGVLQVPTGAYVEVKNDQLSLYMERKKEKIRPFSFDLLDNLSLPGCEFSLKKIKAMENTGIQLENCLDYDKINSNFKVRNRRPGDRFRPPKRGVTKPFKVICSEYGIEPERRSSLVILEDESGEIAWIEDIGPSEKYKADKGTENLLAIFINRKESPND